MKIHRSLFTALVAGLASVTITLADVINTQGIPKNVFAIIYLDYTHSKHDKLALPFYFFDTEMKTSFSVGEVLDETFGASLKDGITSALFALVPTKKTEGWRSGFPWRL